MVICHVYSPAIRPINVLIPFHVLAQQAPNPFSRIFAPLSVAVILLSAIISIVSKSFSFWYIGSGFSSIYVDCS